MTSISGSENWLFKGKHIFWIICCVSAIVGAAVTGAVGQISKKRK
jgi:hypothetical protein